MRISISPRVFTMLIPLVLALVACGPAAAPQAAMPAAAAPQSCPGQARGFVSALDAKIAVWGQTADRELHGQDFQAALPRLRQPGTDLSQLIGRLRDLQSEVRSLDAPACAEPVRAAALDAMDSTIRVFQRWRHRWSRDMVSSSAARRAAPAGRSAISASATVGACRVRARFISLIETGSIAMIPKLDITICP